MSAPVYLTYAEAAEVARCSPNTIRHWVNTGRLSARKPGRHPLIVRDELLRFIEASASPTVRQ